MRPIIMLMLAVDVGIVLVTVWTILVTPIRQRGRPPLWTSLAISLAVCASTSLSIADRHVRQPGAEALEFAGALLIGMAVMAILLLIRQRRGLDSPSG